MTEHLWTLQSDDIDQLALGARILGSGGGGKTWAISLAVRDALEEHGPVTVFPVCDMSPGDEVVSVGLIGSILAYSEKPTGADPFVEAFRVVADRSASTFVCSYETAGMNTFSPVLVAAASDVPLVDADGMGRAFSGLHQTSFHLGGIPMSPCTIVGSSGGRIDVIGQTPEESENVLRTLMRPFGGWAAFAGYRMTAGEMSATGITGSLRRAMTLGTALSQAIHDRGNAREGIERFSRSAGGVNLIAHGRVVEVIWRNAEDEQHIDRRTGSITIESAVDGRYLRIEAQNEFLLLMEDGRIIAATPTIIDVLDTRTGTPILAEELIPGFAVSILTVSPPRIWTTEAAQPLIGLQAMGYPHGQAVRAG